MCSLKTLSLHLQSLRDTHCHVRPSFPPLMGCLADTREASKSLSASHISKSSLRASC